MIPSRRVREMRLLAFQRSFVWLALGVTVAPASLAQELPRASELTHEVLELRRTASIRIRGRMIYTDSAKHQRVIQISMLQKGQPQRTSLLWSVTDPPDARMRILAENSSDGRTKVWLAHENEDVVTLPPKRWSEAILASHLTVEDLVDDYFAWPKQAVMGEELFGTHKCYIVRSEPGAERDSAYATVTSWIDEATLLPIRILKKPVGAGVPKEILSSGLRKSGGRWGASIVELRILGSSASTRLVFTAGSENARVQASELDPHLLFGVSVPER